MRAIESDSLIMAADCRSSLGLDPEFVMITLDEAIEIAIANKGDHLAFNPDHILEKEYGWVIFPNSKEFIETGEFRSALVGSGGVLVLKDSGKAIRFGSAIRLEKHLEIYESGYLDHDNWDIVITSVVNMRVGVGHILALGATYVTPEEESGILWKIPKNYSRKRIKELLSEPPIRLNIGSVYRFYDAIDRLKKQRCFEHRIEPNQGYENVP